MSRPVVVIGDALLDWDVVGRADRVCPDAPALVVDVSDSYPRPGGAALAATLVRASLSAAATGDVVLITPMVADRDGELLRDLLGRWHPDVEVVALPAAGTTAVKRRVRVGGQSVLRLDSGGVDGRRIELTDRARRLIGEAGAVLVADYGQGTADAPDLRAALGALTRAPVVWDPHPRGPRPIPGAHLVTPNAREAARFAEVRGADTDLTAAGTRARTLVATWQVAAVAVTLGERGALLSYGEGAPLYLPARSVPGHDACGAGDRFAAAATVALAGGAVTSEAVAQAVREASDYVAAGGASAGGLQGAAAPPDVAGAPGGASRPPVEAAASSAPSAAERLAERTRAAGGTVVATGGCFDLLHAGHVETLRAARALGDCLIVCINSDESVRRLKGPQRPLLPAVDRVRVLLALASVDAVMVFEEQTPEAALARIRPHIWAKGGDYAGRTLPEEALLASWGGCCIALPYLAGRSTTALVSRATAR